MTVDIPDARDDDLEERQRGGEIERECVRERERDVLRVNTMDEDHVDRVNAKRYFTYLTFQGCIALLKTGLC